MDQMESVRFRIRVRLFEGKVRMQVVSIKAVFALGLACFSLPVLQVVADDVTPPTADASARFSLGSRPMPVSIPPTVKTLPDDSDLPLPEAFEWKALTSNSAAAGSDPVVGAGSGKPYYDFKDGQPYPFYIYSSKR